MVAIKGPDPLHIANALDSVVRAYEKLAIPISAEEKKLKNDRGEFEYIPLYMEQFFNQLHYAIQLVGDKCNIKFIDVGCGIGTKCLCAAAYSYRIDAYGLEIYKPYVKAAKKLVKESGSHRVEIIEDDALTADYSLFDLIYFYCPLSSNDLEVKLEKQIIKTAKAGALFLTNLPKGGEKVWNKEVVESMSCFRGIFRKL